MTKSDQELARYIAMSLIAVVIMLILYWTTAVGLLGDNPVGQGSNYTAPLIVPASYAFAIWSVIYLGVIIFPIYQWIRRKHGASEWKQLHLLFSVNVIFNGLWLVAASYDWQWITVGVIIILLITLYLMNTIIASRIQAGDPVNYWLERLPLSIYFAWITLATALNFSSALDFYNWSGFGIDETTWTLIIITVASSIAFLAYRRFQEVGYAAVVVWAFVALYLRHQGEIPSIAGLSMVVVILFAFLIIRGIRRQLSV